MLDTSAGEIKRREGGHPRRSDCIADRRYSLLVNGGSGACR
jgi:hypothetical protein